MGLDDVALKLSHELKNFFSKLDSMNKSNFTSYCCLLKTDLDHSGKTVIVQIMLMSFCQCLWSHSSVASSKTQLEWIMMVTSHYKLLLIGPEQQ